MEINHQISIENVHIKLTQERNQDMEERYNVVIEDLYKEISEWEQKHNDAIRYHQERSNEVEVKHSK